jgi:hypothetical protein
MIPVFHMGGPVPCKQPALAVKKRMPFPRHDLPADNVVLLTGKEPNRGDPLLCGYCGQPLHPQWLFLSDSWQR